MSEENKGFTEEDVAAIAETAAKKAVASIFDYLDIDITKKESLRRFREDLAFLKDQREGSVQLKKALKKGSLYLMGTAALGMVYFLWDVLKDGLHMWLQGVVK